MDLKKIKKKNPGFEFSIKSTKKASQAILQNSLKSKLNIDAYKEKYVDTIRAKDSESKEGLKKESTLIDDKKWKFLKKTSTERDTDVPEEPKAGLFNEEGEEVAAED